MSDTHTNTLTAAVKPRACLNLQHGRDRHSLHSRSQSDKPCRPWLLGERCGPEDRKQLERSPAVKAVGVQRTGWEKGDFLIWRLDFHQKCPALNLFVQQTEVK